MLDQLSRAAMPALPCCHRFYPAYLSLKSITKRPDSPVGWSGMAKILLLLKAASKPGFGPSASGFALYLKVSSQVSGRTPGDFHILEKSSRSRRSRKGEWYVIMIS
jgi:hypothetical protein